MDVYGDYLQALDDYWGAALNWALSKTASENTRIESLDKLRATTTALYRAQVKFDFFASKELNQLGKQLRAQPDEIAQEAQKWTIQALSVAQGRGLESTMDVDDPEYDLEELATRWQSLRKRYLELASRELGVSEEQ